MKARAREVLYELSTALETAGSKRQQRSKNAQAWPDQNGSVGPAGHSGRDAESSEDHTLPHPKRKAKGGNERSQGKEPRATASKRQKPGGMPNGQPAEQADVVSVSLPLLRLQKLETELSEAARPNGVPAATNSGGGQAARAAGPPSSDTDKELAVPVPGSPAGNDLEMHGSPSQRSREKKGKVLGSELLRQAAKRTLAALGEHLFCRHIFSSHSSPCSCHLPPQDPLANIHLYLAPHRSCNSRCSA